MTNKELELKKSQQYKHLKENVEKVFGKYGEDLLLVNLFKVQFKQFANGQKKSTIQNLRKIYQNV